MAREPNHYALVVGIDDYPHFRSLQGARIDANEIHRWLIDQAVGGGLDPNHVELVLSTANPVSPIQDQIDLALDRLIGISEQNAPPGRFYFYFSGHGFGVSADDVALCLARWSNRYRNAALSSRDYRNLLVESGKYPEVVLWFDCCRLSKVRVAGRRSELGWARAGGGNVRYFEGFATEFQNASFEAEVRVDPTMEPEVRGHFTSALLDALRGAAARPGGGVLFSELKDYLEREVPLLARAAGHEQTPAVSNQLAAGATLGRAQPGAVVTIEFTAGRQGIIVLEPPLGDQPLRRDDAATGPWTIPLSRGNHRLEEERTGDEKYFKVIATNGAMGVVF
jgi:uncharacterized caspase-like protein